MQRARRPGRPVTTKWPGGRMQRRGRATTQEPTCPGCRSGDKGFPRLPEAIPRRVWQLAAGARSFAIANAWRSFPTPIRPCPASRANPHGPGRCPAHERAAPAPPPCRRRGSGRVGRADLQERPRPRPQVLLGKRPSHRDAWTKAPERQRRARHPPRTPGHGGAVQGGSFLRFPFRFSCIVDALPGAHHVGPDGAQ